MSTDKTDLVFICVHLWLQFFTVSHDRAIDTRLTVAPKN